MDGKAGGTSPGGTGPDNAPTYFAGPADSRSRLGADGARSELSADASTRLFKHIKSRPPPPLPLTPPELSRIMYTLDPRRRPYTAVASESSFPHQASPDYGSSSSSTTSASTTPSTVSPAIPRRSSYTKTVAVGEDGSPLGQNHPKQAPAIAPDASGRKGPLPFLPSSYSSAAPFLPPPPPYIAMTETGGQQQQQQQQVDRKRGGADARTIDLQGEIISVMDDAGVGWRRHTRVYGGGVCLACAASGGGFFGQPAATE